jgi:hypothetical protein
MATRIPSSNLPVSTSVGRMQDARKRAGKQEEDFSKYAPPHRAQYNYIPSPDVLKNMIDRALEALAKGVYWDRGSIINLVL